MINAEFTQANSNTIVTVLDDHLLTTTRPFYFPATWTSAPWQLSALNKERIATPVPGITGLADDIDLKRWCSLTIIASYQADNTICTDGFASSGTRNGGSAAVVTKGSSIQPKVLITIKTKGRTFTSSYKHLPWNQHYPEHAPMGIILQLLYSFAQIANH